MGGVLVLVDALPAALPSVVSRSQVRSSVTSRGLPRFKIADK